MTTGVTARAGNIPSEVSSFVGRESELTEIVGLLGRHRLVTVTGVGGVGKSRLAHRVAAALRERFPDGVWVAELDALRDEALLAHTVGEVLGVKDQSMLPQTEVLATFLAERRLLLVLDTCEHLVEGCALLVQAVLRAAPGVRVLAVSRQPLELTGEQVHVLGPLPVPPSDELPELRACPSVRLFTERAAAADRGFRLTARNAATVARLCRGLDGIPLALELAAVRLRALTPDQLAVRLGDRFQLLGGPQTTDDARHATLLAAIGWSHQLCDPEERLLWARLSVFAGDFDVAAAEQVCADPLLPSARIAELTERLVAKSILAREERGDDVRLRMLDTLREYGTTWLAKLSETEAMRRRHRDHYLALARRCEAAWFGPNQAEWGVRLRAELTNLFAALDFCFDEPEEVPWGVELAAALRPLWVPYGFVKVGRHYFERALEHSPRPGPELLGMLAEAARVATAQGDMDASQRWLARCRELLRAHPDGAKAGTVTYLSGANAALRGDQAAAIPLLQRAVDQHRTDGDPGVGLAMALLAYGLSLVLAGELRRGMATLEESQRVSDEFGECWVRSHADHFLSLAWLAKGDPAHSVAHAQQAVRAKRGLHDGFGVALSLDVLARGRLGQGKAEVAARLQGAAQRLWVSFGTPQLGSPDLIKAREACERGAIEELGEPAYRAAFRSGHALDLDAAIDCALTEAPGG